MKAELNRIISIKKSLGTEMQPPASENEIYDLKNKVKDKFKIELPIDYADFLRITNGLVFSGLFIYGCKTLPIAGYKDRFILGLIEANKLWWENKENRKFIFFADDDLSLYGMNLSTGEFEELDRSSGDSLNTCSSFSKILSDSMKERIDSIEEDG